MWSTQVFVLDDDGGEVITVTTAGEKPNVKVGQLVVLVQAGGPALGDQRAQRRGVPRRGDQDGVDWPREGSVTGIPAFCRVPECPFRCFDA